jgi:non-specific serine/threonine protein kinase
MCAARRQIGLPPGGLPSPALRLLHRALEENEFAAAWSAGEALTLEQATGEALRVETPSPRPSQPAPSSNDAALTAREREVASLLASGLSNRAVAERLVISESTAEVHVRHILSKLGFTSRAQVAAWAAQHDRSDRARFRRQVHVCEGLMD